jgi:hypothetical protein
MMRRNRGLYVNPSGKDREAGAVVLGRSRENPSVDSVVQVQHKPRDESNGHAEDHLWDRFVFVALATHQLVNVERLPLSPTFPIVRKQSKVWDLYAHRTKLIQAVSVL